MKYFEALWRKCKEQAVATTTTAAAVAAAAAPAATNVVVWGTVHSHLEENHYAKR